MAVEPLQVEQAPISRPIPELEVPDVTGRPKGRMLLGYVVWGSIGAVIAVNQPTPVPTAATSSFLIKGADEDSWQPLEGGE